SRTRSDLKFSRSASRTRSDLKFSRSASRTRSDLRFSRTRLNREPSLGNRTSGVLLHPTSLPSPHGSGDLGPNPRALVDFLAASKQSRWQMLPAGPVGYANSPYSAQSAFAGNPMFLAPELLVERGLLDASALSSPPPFPAERVDFGTVPAYREQQRRAAFER